MRRLLWAAVLLSGCDSKPPPGAGPAAPEVAPPPPAAPPAADPESPLQVADLTALGYPSSVRIVRFGASKEFQCLADGHPIILFFAVEEHESAHAAGRSYKARRDARAAAGEVRLKDEDRYGQKSYAVGHEVMFLKDKRVILVRAGPKADADVKPEAVESVLRGAAERLAR